MPYLVVVDCCIYSKRSAPLEIHQNQHIPRKRAEKHSDFAFNFEAEIVRYSADNDAHVAGVASPTSTY